VCERLIVIDVVSTSLGRYLTYASTCMIFCAVFLAPNSVLMSVTKWRLVANLSSHASHGRYM